MTSSEPLFVSTSNDMYEYQQTTVYRVKINIRYFDTMWIVNRILSILYNYQITEKSLFFLENFFILR